MSTFVNFPKLRLPPKPSAVEPPPVLVEVPTVKLLEVMTLAELKEIAKHYEIPGRSSMNKAQLLKALKEAENI